MPVVLVQDLYQGTVYSASVAWPANMNSARFRGNVSQNDAADPGHSFVFYAEVSFDGGQSYSYAATNTWTSGQIDPRTSLPITPEIGLAYGQSPQKPTHARIRIDSPGTLSFGASIDFA